MNTQDTNFLSDAIRNNAMIVEVSATGLGLSRTDKKASADSEDAHNAVRGSARVVVSRLPGCDEQVKELGKIQTEARNFTNTMTMPWGTPNSTGHRRLLTNKIFEPWIRGFSQYHQMHEDKKKQLLVDAPELLKLAQHNKGKFDIKLPTLEEIENAFTLTYSLEPVPNADGFGKQLSEGVDQYLRRQFEANMQASYQAGQSERLSAVRPLLERVVDRMESYEERERQIADGKDPGKTGIFRDSLVGNLQELAAPLEALNILNDPGLSAIIERVKAFNGFSAKELRDRPQMRADAKSAAKAALTGIDAWLSGS